MNISNKKGVSIMVGYVLLVSFVLVIGVVVYQWMRTYVPQESIECPDGVSVFVEDYTCSASNLNLTLKNNGKFNIGGFFIYATNSPEQELATFDLSPNLSAGGDFLSPSGVKSFGEGNSMRPNEEESFAFDISQTFYSIEILPIRWESINNRQRIVSCQNSRIRETITCP